MFKDVYLCILYTFSNIMFIIIIKFDLSVANLSGWWNIHLVTVLTDNYINMHGGNNLLVEEPDKEQIR
jgi:hypothetical protein